MRLAALLLLASTATAQPSPPDALPDSVRHELQLELRQMNAADQRARYMSLAGTFSPCVADSLQRVLQGFPIEESIAVRQRIRAEAAARTTPQERALLVRMMRATDAANLARLREIIDAHGWPSDERTGADVSPVVFLLHAPHAMDEMRATLLAEVQAGRLPGRELAMALDKSRKVRGELQLYGTGDEYDAATQALAPPRVADLGVTNAARRELGLPPLGEGEYRLAE